MRNLPKGCLLVLMCVMGVFFADATAATAAAIAMVSSAGLSESMGSHVSGTLKKWQMVSLPFDGPPTDKLADGHNPFDVELKCRFTHAEGDSIVVPGFYNGDNQWLVRFMPNREGTWTWSSRSSIGAMDGKSGTIEVAGNDVHHRGAIQI
ncbi:DUF5060 domain-containing protein, partial [Planctomycetota bacterium]